ncbi:MAG: glycosyltransferase [Patescibacteria group bacterium]|nr:glycosyltransferase [Patescibacteria group bacterium]
MMISVVTLCPTSYIHYLRDLAASLTNQTYQNFQWVVLHVGVMTTDEAHEFVECVSAVPCVKFIHSVEPDPGISSCRNEALKCASGRFITMVDADDTVEPTYLEKMVAVAGPKTLVCPGLREFELGSNAGWPTWGFTLNDFLAANRIFACSMYPRELVDEIGGYDEALNFLGIEDYEFWIRAIKAGYTVKVVQELLFNYRVHRGSHTARHSQLDKERFEYVWKKHLPVG